MTSITHLRISLLACVATALLAACGGGPSLTDNPGNNNFPPGTNHGSTSYDPPITIPAQDIYIDRSGWKASCLDPITESVYQNDSLAAWAQRIFDGVNSQRAANGSGVMLRSHNLDRIAQAQARDMALRNYFAHATPEGIMPWDRIQLAVLKDYSMVVDGRQITGSAGKLASDISFDGVGENAARGVSTSGELVSGWMNSAGHRANLLNPIYNYVGTGVYFDPGDPSMPVHVVQLYVEGM